MSRRSKSNYTKSQLASDIADKVGDVTKSKVSEMLSVLQTIAISQLKANGTFTVPGVVKLVVKHKAATPAKTMNIFGKETRVKAKPARKVVRGRILKSIKEAV